MINLSKVQAAHKKCLKAHQTMVTQELEAAGKIGAAHPGKHATFKHRTHRLEKSTRHRVVRTRSSHIVRLSNAVRYAPFLEFGTKPHVIAARRAKALRFTVRGQTLFRKSVNHPGTKPYKFLWRATNAAYRIAGPNLAAGMQRISRTF